MNLGQREQLMQFKSMAVFAFTQATFTTVSVKQVTLYTVMCALLFSLLMQTVSAFGLFGMPGPVKLQPRSKHGAVYTRAIVQGENGQPIYVEYDLQGDVVAEIGEAVGELKNVSVFSAVAYNAYIADHTQLQTDFGEIQLLSKAQYQAQVFVTVDGKTVQKTKQLNESTQYLAILSADKITQESDELLILRQYPIDPSQAIDAKTLSLLIDDQGDIVKESPYNIAFRVGFFGDDSKTNGSSDSVLGRDNADIIHGPIEDAVVRLSEVFVRVAVTDEQGKYSMEYSLPPCPGFSIFYQTEVYLQLPYGRFNPRHADISTYYLTRKDEDFCAQYSAFDINALSAEASIMQPVKAATDFPVDLMVVYGQASLANGQQNVALAASTKYDHNNKSLYRIARQSTDFDGDGIADYAILGDKQQITDTEGEISTVFKPSTTGVEQGIWLSSKVDSSLITVIETTISAQNTLWQTHEEGGDITAATTVINALAAIPAAPDFTRLADWSDDFKDRALLSQISDADLAETDIYIFRESTGMLVAEQKGVAKSYRGNEAGVDSNIGAFKYSMKLRGAASGIFDYASSGNFSDWQVTGNINPALHQRKADHLKQGEKVKIVAINRKTGYIGTQITSLMVKPGSITVYADPIVMRPPNLKIWAERVAGKDYRIDAEAKTQKVGNEGAASNDDEKIVVYSEWLDKDDVALPPLLAGYGFTGRIAKVIAKNQLTELNYQGVAHFDIPPGRKTQVIQLPEVDLGTHHIYIQVSGEPVNRNPIFDSGSATNHEGILQYRPEYFVPFKVPVWDEESSNLQVQAYQQSKQSDPSYDAPKPKPFYQWLYRSELQYSLYDFNLQEIQVTDAQNATEDILSLENPVISSSDQLIEFIYDIATDGTNNDIDPLQSWSYDGDKELIFEIGGQEVAVTIDGQTQALSIDDMSVLTDFSAEDLLSISLYSNNDAGNILWEWAFKRDIDLKLYTPTSIHETEIQISEREELTKGGMIFVNLDNDDQDNFFDHVDTDVSAVDNDQGKEDDLARLELTLPSFYQGIVTLTVPEGGDDIKLWSTDSKKYLAPQTMRVPEDFTEVNGTLLKTVWVEGVNAQYVQRQSKIKMEFTKGEIRLKDEVAITVLGVESITWSGKGNSVKDDDILDDDPNWPVALTPASKRIFPGARLADLDKALDKVDVKVKLTTTPIFPVTIFLKSLDVDDPTAHDNLVDNDIISYDNRGRTPAMAGLLIGADAKGILPLFTLQQEITTVFQTTMQPGDNYRIAASFDSDFITQLVNRERNGISNEERQLITDNSQKKALKSKGIRKPNNYLSVPLTVWRFMHIEIDSMANPGEKNTVTDFITDIHSTGEGDEHSFICMQSNIQVTIDVDGQGTMVPDLSINAKDEYGNGRFEGYRSWVKIGNLPKIFKIYENDDQCVFKYTYDIPFTAVSPNNDYIVKGNIKRLEGHNNLFTLNIKSKIGGPVTGSEFIGGVLEVAGVKMNITDFNLTNGQLVVANSAVIPIKLHDDDDTLLPQLWSHLGHVQESDIIKENRFAAAYLRPRYDYLKAYSESNVSFISNTQHGAVYSWGSQALNKEQFWTVYLLAAFQDSWDGVNRSGRSDMSRDFDGSYESGTWASANNGVEGGVLFYMESLRDGGLLAEPELLNRLTVHEIGHNFNLPDLYSKDASMVGIMNGSLGLGTEVSEAYYFLPKHLDIIRDQLKPRGLYEGN
ncbi:MAG: hypothetical protein GY951_10195 [Psychromonas sp.]|nr:hypothetical protein [Psychromonas sp.]